MTKADQLLLAALVAALTSAVVTLAVEWLAKPTLEARKERILAKHRARANVKRCLGRTREMVYILLGPWPHTKAMQATPLHVRTLYRKRIAATLGEISVCADDLLAAVVDALPHLSLREREILLPFAGYLRAVADTAEPDENFSLLAEKIDLLTQWYERPRWQRRKSLTINPHPASRTRPAD
ncbi:hypothetical protein PSH25_006537 [Micromonospora sp. PSH25]|nr:hypothetical protein [Micromonospora foliorum]